MSEVPYGPATNRDSWKWIHGFIQSFIREQNRGWASMAAIVVQSLDEEGLTDWFRIGQSVSHIILSTQQTHELDSAARVTLEFGSDGSRVRVCYSRLNVWFGEPETEETVAPADAVACVLRYLEKLWLETKPGQPLPPPLSHR